MRIFNYEIKKISPTLLEDIRKQVLDKVELNAKNGLVTAELELRVHRQLLQDAEQVGRTEAEIKGYQEAIERDQKSINFWENQLKAVSKERFFKSS